MLWKMEFGNLTEDPFSWHDLSYTFPHWLYDTFIYIKGTKITKVWCDKCARLTKRIHSNKH